MKNLKIEQHHLLGELVYELKNIMEYKDLGPFEQLELVIMKISVAKDIAQGKRLFKTYDALNRIEIRLTRLLHIQKSYKLPARVRDIIDTINW